MTLPLLVLDQAGEMTKAITELCDGTTVAVKRVSTPREAKAFLVQSGGCALIAPTTSAEDTLLGLTLCKELRAFEAYRDLPVFLFADQAEEELIRSCVSAGVSGLLLKPFTTQSLRGRLAVTIPQLKVNTPTTPVEPLKSRPAITEPETVAVDDDLNRKLKIVQTVLAKVLHNLKTSDLLVISEEEDVPRIVYEMTRTVCGISQTVPAKATAAKEAPKESKVELNLDNVFGRK